MKKKEEWSDEDSITDHTNLSISLSNKIENLENENETLKNENTDLTSRLEKLRAIINNYHTSQIDEL
jgi:chaperonin cofactor prefoldin